MLIDSIVLLLQPFVNNINYIFYGLGVKELMYK